MALALKVWGLRVSGRPGKVAEWWASHCWNFLCFGVILSCAVVCQLALAVLLVMLLVHLCV